MKPLRGQAVLFSLFMIAAGTSAATAGESWRIVQSAGAVKAGGAGLTPAAVSPDQVLPAEAWVETAATGRVVLVRGAESIAVGPNSRVQLPSLEVNGNTQVLQTLGSALYQIGKQQKPHFQVDTPYLAAVVKGTTFTVTVEEGVASVAVTEGLVQVATPDHADVEFIRPGFTGLVSRDSSSDVVVMQSDRGAVVPPPAKSGDKPKDKATSNETSTKVASNAGSGPIVIASAIGETKVDVQAVSGGLAFNVVEPSATKDQRPSSGAGNVADGLTTAVDKTASAATGVGGAVTSVLSDAATGAVGAVAVAATPAIDQVPVTVDIGAGAAPDVGGGSGVGVDIGVGGGNGNGGSGGNVGVDVGVGVGNVDVGLGLGVGNGGGLNVALGLGGGNAGGNVGGPKIGLGH